MDGTLTCETYYTYYDTMMFIEYCLVDHPDEVSDELVLTGGFIQKNLNGNKAVYVEREIRKLPGAPAASAASAAAGERSAASAVGWRRCHDGTDRVSHRVDGVQKTAAGGTRIIHMV